MKMLKWLFVTSCVLVLLNRKLFVDYELFRCFILVPYSYNLTMMMKLIFSFFPSYFSIIVLAKGKIRKSINLFPSHIGPKRCWPIRFQDFKSNIPLEQRDEIVYFFTCWCQKLRVHRKILGCLWSQVVVTTLVTRWMNGLMNWADF